MGITCSYSIWKDPVKFKILKIYKDCNFSSKLACSSNCYTTHQPQKLNCTFLLNKSEIPPLTSFSQWVSRFQRL